MKNNNKTGSLAFIIGVITSVITVMSLAVAIFALFDRKKKKEDKELQDYLDTSINQRLTVQIKILYNLQY